MKRILITGASTGIGAQTARLLSEGNDIFVHYFSSEAPAREVAADIERQGGRAHLIQADLSTEEGCRKLIDLVAAQTDRLDVLVNNAGAMIERKNVAAITWELMAQTFALNTYAVMMVTALCLPLLEKGADPSIINMTSVAIRHGAPTATVYGAAKAAVDSFTRGIARELAPRIRVNAIAPGVILTPFHDEVTSGEQLETFRKNNPLQKHGDPLHIARAVQFIIDNDFMNGETLDINGGIYMR
jgi:3-oxoacyl-[acyl-carrier protein] reductase